MKNNIYSILIISLFATLLIVSCSKTTTVDPASQTCYMASTSNAKGNVLDRLTYDTSNRLISETNDSLGLTFGFVYTAQSLMDKITIAYKTPTTVLNLVTTFTYDAANKATKAVTTLNGSVYQTNVFTYVGTQLSQINSTDFQGSIENVRFEYTGENISKVYQKFDAEKEYLYYEITKFDDKKITYPDAYKALAMGLIGLTDDFYYMNKNNALSEKFYEDHGVVYFTSDNTYEYSVTSQPTKLTAAITEDGIKRTMINTYQYNCK